jgi:hypothetical protein
MIHYPYKGGLFSLFNVVKNYLRKQRVNFTSEDFLSCFSDEKMKPFELDENLSMMINKLKGLYPALKNCQLVICTKNLESLNNIGFSVFDDNEYLLRPREQNLDIFSDVGKQYLYINFNGHYSPIYNEYDKIQFNNSNDFNIQSPSQSQFQQWNLFLKINDQQDKLDEEFKFDKNCTETILSLQYAISLLTKINSLENADEKICMIRKKLILHISVLKKLLKIETDELFRECDEQLKLVI